MSIHDEYIILTKIIDEKEFMVQINRFETSIWKKGQILYDVSKSKYVIDNDGWTIIGKQNKRDIDSDWKYIPDEVVLNCDNYLIDKMKEYISQGWNIKEIFTMEKLEKVVINE